MIVSSSFLGKKEKKRIWTQYGELESIDFKIQFEQIEPAPRALDYDLK